MLRLRQIADFFANTCLEGQVGRREDRKIEKNSTII
jgi:hypothetical protein